MDYKQKYLKYKNKYLNSKLEGGVCKRKSLSGVSGGGVELCYNYNLNFENDPNPNAILDNNRGILAKIIEYFDTHLKIKYKLINGEKEMEKLMCKLSLLEFHTLFFNRNEKMMNTKAADTDQNIYLNLKSKQDKLYAFFGEDRFHAMKLNDENNVPYFDIIKDTKEFDNKNFFDNWIKFVDMKKIYKDSVNYSSYYDKMGILNCSFIIDDVVLDMKSPDTIIEPNMKYKKLLLFIILYTTYLTDRNLLQILHEYYKIDNQLIYNMKKFGLDYVYGNKDTKINKFYDVLSMKLEKDPRNDMYIISTCDLDPDLRNKLMAKVENSKMAGNIGAVFKNTMDVDLPTIRSKGNFIGLLVLYKKDKYPNGPPTIDSLVKNEQNSELENLTFVDNNDRENIKKLSINVNNIGYFKLKYWDAEEKKDIDKYIGVVYSGSSRDKEDKIIKLINDNKIDLMMGDMNTTNQVSAKRIIEFASSISDEYYAKASNFYKFHTCKKFRVPLFQQQFSKIVSDPDINNKNDVFMGTKDYIIVKKSFLNTTKTTPNQTSFQMITPKIYVFLNEERKVLEKNKDGKEEEKTYTKNDIFPYTQDTEKSIRDINDYLPPLPNNDHFSDHFLVERQLKNNVCAYTLNFAADQKSLLEYFIKELEELYDSFYFAWTNESNTLEKTKNIC